MQFFDTVGAEDGIWTHISKKIGGFEPPAFSISPQPHKFNNFIKNVIWVFTLLNIPSKLLLYMGNKGWARLANSKLLYPSFNAANVHDGNVYPHLSPKSFSITKLNHLLLEYKIPCCFVYGLLKVAYSSYNNISVVSLRNALLVFQVLDSTTCLFSCLLGEANLSINFILFPRHSSCAIPR